MRYPPIYSALLCFCKLIMGEAEPPLLIEVAVSFLPYVHCICRLHVVCAVSYMVIHILPTVHCICRLHTVCTVRYGRTYCTVCTLQMHTTNCVLHLMSSICEIYVAIRILPTALHEQCTLHLMSSVWHFRPQNKISLLKCSL